MPHKFLSVFRFLPSLLLCLLLSIPALAQPGTDLRANPHGSGDAVQVNTGLPTTRFTLNAAIEAMRHGHPLLNAAKANQRAAAADTLGAGLWTNPTLDGAYARSFVNSQTDPVGSVGIGITQFLETANVPEARRATAALYQRAVETEGETTVRALAFDVELACVALSAAASKVQLYAESNAELDRANQIVTARVKAGAVPQYDATRIGVAVAQARAALADAQADMIGARGDLDVAVGADSQSLVGLPAFDLFELATPDSLDNALSQARKDRPDIRAAQARADAAQAQVNVARRVVFPGFSLRLGTYFGATPGEFGGMVSVGVPLPVVDRGQGAIGAALARAEAANFLVEAMTLQAGQRVRAAWEEAARRRITLHDYQQTGVTRSQGMVQEAEAGYRAGKLSVLELVDAYVAKRDARLRAIELAQDARAADVRLRRAVQAGITMRNEN